MSKQKTFEYKFVNNNILPNFYVNFTNKNAYEGVVNSGNKTLLFGPRKSGKTEIGKMWATKNNAVVYLACNSSNGEYSWHWRGSKKLESSHKKAFKNCSKSSKKHGTG